MASKVVGNLIVNLAANIASFESSMRRANKTSQRQMKAMERRAKETQDRMRNFGHVVAGAFAAIGAAQAVRGLIRASAEVERMQAALVTVTGSSEAAAKEFAKLEAFAAKTPFQLQEVVNGFIKLKARGLDPSIEAMTAYGNVAGATGKTLDQFIEAVGDAATGEMERLKEFGIVARQQADEVKFTFQGVTTTVGRNADEITDYLRGLGETKFAGGMERQANTIGGAISNLQDAVFKLMSSGDVDGLKDSIRGLSDTLSDPATAEGLQTFINGMIKVAEWGAKAASGAAKFAKGIGIAAAELMGFSGEDDLAIIEGQIERLERQMMLAETAQMGFLDNLLGKDEQLAAFKEQLNKRLELLRDYRDQVRKDMNTETAVSGKINSLADMLPGLKTALSTKSPESSFVWVPEATAEMSLFNDEQKLALELASQFETEAQSIAVMKSKVLELSQAGMISNEVFEKAIADLNKQLEESEKGFEIMKAAGEEAGRAIQDAFADFFMDMDSDIKNMAKNFIDAIRKMISQALALQTVKAMFGGTSFGKFLGIDSPDHGAIGGLQSGMTIVGEHGPELVNLPSGTNVTPSTKMGGVSLSLSVNASGAMSPAQVLAAVKEGSDYAVAQSAKLMQGRPL